MAAELDHRSPDASQWGVGSSGGVVGVGAREGGGGCSARGGVGSGKGSGGGGGRYWPSRSSGQSLTGTGAGAGSEVRRADIWGQPPCETENTEVLGNSSVNRGVQIKQQLQTPSSGERRQRASATGGGVGSSGRREAGEKGKGKGRSKEPVSGFVEEDVDQDGVKSVDGDHDSEGSGLHTPGGGRRKGPLACGDAGGVGAGAGGGGGGGADTMETDSAYDVKKRFNHAMARTGVDAVSGGVAHADIAVRVGLDDASEVEGAGSEMDATGVHHGSGVGAAIRAPADRLAFKLSVNLIDTYKLINQRYYAEKSRQQEQSAAGEGKPSARQGGVYNHGLDDENFDYIVHEGEVFHGRYGVRETIGKGSFGKVYKAWDEQERIYVALKVIKSKRPFTMQARVEVEILEMLRERDPEGKYNCARMLDQFISHNHQCLVFEILSFNLYELLRSTQFQGVSLHLVRKFARHLLRALAFLSLPQVDVIHCDLKPENILLQHPKRSNIKVIDFGSSCRSNNKMYSYIQSRFYRSPEVMLGLPYTTAIDMWSLGCILVEMHTGEPLFAGVDQFDQMCRIVSVLGMMPTDVVERSPPSHRSQFFELDSSGEDSDDTGSNSDDDEGVDGADSSRRLQKARSGGSRRSRRLATSVKNDSQRHPSAAAVTRASAARAASSTEEDEDSDHNMVDYSPESESSSSLSLPSLPPPPNADVSRPARRYRLRRHLLLKRARSLGTNKGGQGRAGDGWMIPPRIPLSEVVGVCTGGPSGRREGEAGHDPETYRLFVNLVERMLDHRPESRITPAEALLHPFLVDAPPSHVSVQPAAANAVDPHDVDSWLTPENAVSQGRATNPPTVHPTTPEGVGGSGGSIVNPAVGAPDTALRRRRGLASDSGSEQHDREHDRGHGDDFESASNSPQRPRSAPGRRRRAAVGGDSSGSGGADDNDGRNLDPKLSEVSPPGDRYSAGSNRYRWDGNAHDRESGGGARGTSVGSKSSSGGGSGCGNGGLGGKGSGGGSSCCGGGRGGGKGAGASGSGSGSSRGRVAGVIKVRTRGLIGRGVNCDASAKRAGQRSKKEVAVHAEAETGGASVQGGRRHDRRHTPLGGGGGGGLSVETRRGRAARRGRGQSMNGGGRDAMAVGAGAGAEGHVEAASGVAQLSLHSSSSAWRGGNRRQG